MLLPFNLFTGKEADRAQLHFANPAMWGACNWRVGSSGDPMTIQHDGHYRSYRRQRGRSLTADYDDAVSDLDMQYGCQAVLMADQEHFLGLAIMRGRMEGPCDSSALFAFERVIRHAQRAVRVHREQVLGEDGPLSLRGISIAARNRRDDRSFQAALAGLLRIGDNSVGPHLHRIIVGQSDHSRGTWSLSILRLPRRPHGLGFDPHVIVSAKPLRNRLNACRSRELFDAS